MKKNVVMIVVLVIALIGAVALFLYAFNSGRAARPAEHATSSTAMVEQIVLTPKKFTEEGKSSAYQITAEYPEVSGLTDPIIEKKINVAIADRVNEVIADFKQSMASVRVEKGESSTLDIGYTAEHLATLPHLIVFRLTESYFEAGAAHPGQTTETFNFDTRTGQILTLDDLFVPGTPYVEKISEYSIKELKNRLGNEDQISRGAGPDSENFEAFLLTDGGLKIVFNQYQVAAYAAGEQEVMIPYLELFDIISDAGPIGKIVQ